MLAVARWMFANTSAVLADNGWLLANTG